MGVFAAHHKKAKKEAHPVQNKAYFTGAC
jgi:hypothetical protein